MNIFEKVPTMGDSSNPLLIAMCLIASIILVVVVLIISKTNKITGKEDELLDADEQEELVVFQEVVDDVECEEVEDNDE